MRSEPYAVHDDKHLLVLHKPSGLATTAPGAGECLTRWAEETCGATLHATSRLDAEVTGLVTFARTAAAREALKSAREDDRYARGYLALASVPDEFEERGEWRWSIGVATRDRRLRRAVSPRDRAPPRARIQTARSEYQLRERTIGVGAFWLTPRTGRTHQLRVHAAAAGAPLLGDHRYGGVRRVTFDDGRVVSVRRTMLHCAWLRIPRVGGEGDSMLELESAPPEDFVSLWARVGGSASALAPRPD